MFVSSSGYGENTATYDRNTGKIYFCSDMIGIDEFEENCESDYDENIHIEVPHKNDLDLGQNLEILYLNLYKNFHPKTRMTFHLSFVEKAHIQNLRISSTQKTC